MARDEFQLAAERAEAAIPRSSGQVLAKAGGLLRFTENCVPSICTLLKDSGRQLRRHDAMSVRGNSALRARRVF